MHTLTALIYLPVIIGILIISIITFLRRREAGLLYFAFFAATAAGWLMLQFLSQIVSSDEIGLRLLQSASMFSNFMVYLFLLFVASYTHVKFLNSRFKLLSLLPLLFFCLLSFTPLMIRQVEASTSGIAIKDAGSIYFVEIIFLATYFLFSLFLLARDTYKKPAQLRASNYLLVVALTQAIVLAILASSVFAADAASQLLIPIGLFIMVGLISFAIIRHKLFDVRLVVVRSLTYLLLLATMSGIFALVVFAYGSFFVSDEAVFTGSTVLYAASALLLAFIFQPLKRLFDRITNRLFYRDAYDTQIFLNVLSRALVSTIELDPLLKRSVEVIKQNIKCSYLVVSLYQGNAIEEYGDSIREDLDSKKIFSLLDQLPLKVILTDQLGEGQIVIKRILQSNDVAITAKLSSTGGSGKQHVLGYMFAGQKSSGNPYSPQDLAVLGIIADELAIAVQNALLFEEIKNFNITLQERIDDATRKLRRSNDKLRKLDETKDDFISMASHQLRTPLTSVKGYTSMVLDGDAGKLNALQTKLLTQSFVSAQRMVYLISDLLNVSRLKTGKFIIEPVPTNLAKVIDQEIEQLVETAKGRSLELTYNKPEHFPTYMFDETKLRQVIMNFVDNAIYYTPSGGHIQVNLEDKPKTIEMTVVDDGIGVPRHEQHHLFSKFFRAHNAQRARPDGTGLGLFMAKKVIIAQGGAIIFKSQEGKGSTFGFTFAKSRLQQAPTSHSSAKEKS